MGVAGGVNLYRFNNGNPVSFGDPLGLCPNCRNELSSRFNAEAVGFQENLTPRDRLALGGMAVGAAVGGLGVIALTSGSMAAGASARSVGIAGEAAVGIAKNTTRIASSTGTAAFRVPDGLTKTTLTEVKNVVKLRLTNQLRDFAAFAAGMKRGFDPVVRGRTKLTKPLQEFIQNHGINLKFLP